MHLLRNKLVKSDFFQLFHTAGHCRKGNGQWPGRLALIIFGDRTKKPLPIAIRAVAVNSKTGGKLKLKNSLIRITLCVILFTGAMGVYVPTCVTSHMTRGPLARGVFV